MHEHILREVLRMAATMDFDQPPPFTGQVIHRRIRELSGVEDPYRRAKGHFNRLGMDALPELRAVVRDAVDPLLAAAKFAIAANAIDMAVIATISDTDVRSALRNAPDQPIHGDWEKFRKSVAEAADILFLADNSGEIAIDRLLIEQLGPTRVTLAVRGSPVLNDATSLDARDVGMLQFVEVIDNGSDAPGTILADCSESFLRRFDQADLVIAKGLGNFETLCDVDRNIAFLFKVKCPLVSRHVGLPVGTHAVLHSATLRSQP